MTLGDGARARLRDAARGVTARQPLIVFSLRDLAFDRLPPICCDGAVAAAAVARLRLFMPSLNPLTAPPRSWPMLRSFLVPKIITTTSRTINQCQMLNRAHCPPLVALPADHRAERVGPADHVYVEMLHFLPPDTAGVDDRSGSLVGALLARKPAGSASIRPRAGASSGVRRTAIAMCFFGIIMKCTGATGRMSWNADSSSS